MPPNVTGSVTKLCQCGSRIGLTSACCPGCWPKLTPELRRAWQAARRSGTGIDEALAAVRDHLRKATP